MQPPLKLGQLRPTTRPVSGYTLANHRRCPSQPAVGVMSICAHARTPLREYQDAAMEPALDAEADEELALASEHTLQETSARLLQRTRNSGLILTAYICVAASPQAGACCALGSACSWLYLSLIVKEVEQLPSTYQSPMLAARNIDNWFLQKLAMWATSYRHSLKPRLSIPVGLTLAFVAYNHIVDKSLRLGYVEVSCLVAGFLASKGAMIQEIWENNQQRSSDVEERPHIDLY